MKKTALFLLIINLLSPLLSPLALAANVTLNATVPASPTDFSASIQALDSGNNVPQGSTLSYEITYGSDLSTATNLTVEASWSRGTISGDSSPSVTIVDYVIGSANDAYNNTAPVVDTINRTITWNIASFPANTAIALSCLVGRLYIYL